MIVGGFYGDEGKGKICAYLALRDKPELSVRTGGINAGHTVKHLGREWKLRIVPSAFVNETTKLLIAPGALFRLEVFWREVELTGCKGRIWVDPKSGIITREHVEFEERDSHLSGKIGSTKQGVGAATADRVLRRLKLARDYEELEPILTDVALKVNEAIDEGLTVHIEGTQGFQLSLIHGDYPYVTSRDTTASGVLSEAGVGPKKVDDVIVVFKAYMTRVGGGALPGELSLEESLKKGFLEVATVTGRARRAAPFNLDIARRAIMINSATQAAITKLDVLYPEVKGATSWDKLPREAKKWIEELEEELKIPITLIGTGEEALHTIDRRRELGIGV